jgi:hypothetical protein
VRRTALEEGVHFVSTPNIAENDRERKRECLPARRRFVTPTTSDTFLDETASKITLAWNKVLDGIPDANFRATYNALQNRRSPS